MGLRDLEFKSEYRTNMSDVTKDFLIPILSEAVLYKRAVGFFSSSSLAEIAPGIGRIAQRGGNIRLVASPYLSNEDIEAIDQGYERREEIKRQIVEKRLFESLAELDSLDLVSRKRLNLLADLIASGLLDIKIAVPDYGSRTGMYHEKVGLVVDAAGDKVAFSGSLNDSVTAMHENYEVIDVFRSWNDPEDRVRLKEAALDAIWEDREPHLQTYEFPEIKDEIVKRYRTGTPDYDDDLLEAETNIGSPAASRRSHYPELPETVELRDYQIEAIDAWEKRGYRGIYDMATGTGKTYTALASIARLSQQTGNDLAVIITCPLQHLVEQWVDDLKLFGMEPIIAYSRSPQKDWRKQLETAIFARNLRSPGNQFLCCVTTNATLASEGMQKTLSRLRGNILLVADEAHNLGAPCYQAVLNEDYPYRLALSATFERHHDEEGTQILRNYFGDVCIEYPLEKAIREGMLCEYCYHPVFVELTPDELDEYRILTKELARCFDNSKKGKGELSERGKAIAQRRARLIAGASNKLEKLKRLIEPFAHEDHILVYCGATQVVEPGLDYTSADNDSRRQIDLVVSMLGNDLGMRVSKFTSEEDIAERTTLKNEFRDGNLQALVAIKCLDEGVNIPSIKTAFILASTTNPKEYVQRRGRLLRKAPGKDHAEIYDFITLPYSTETAAGQTIEELRSVYTLIKNEMERGYEFARCAMNCIEALDILDAVSENYRLDELKMLLQSENETNR